MLSISNLNAGYEDLEVLQDVSLELPTGKIGVLMGPNGAGKSTLLKAIFNLVEVKGGDITYNDQRLNSLPTHSLLECGVAYVPQGKINFGMLTVWENLVIGGYHLEDKRVAKENIEHVVSQFPGLKPHINQLAFRLSGGQQQMVAIARALIMQPKLLLLDEPSLGLSPKLVKEVFRLIKHLQQTFNLTVLIVEHNIKAAFNIADIGYVLVNGQLIGQGTTLELQNSELLQKVFVGKFD